MRFFYNIQPKIVQNGTARKRLVEETGASKTKIVRILKKNNEVVAKSTV